MRKLVLGLATSTAIFAASTLYFWRQLAVERSAPAPGAAPVEIRSASQPVTGTDSTSTASGTAQRARPVEDGASAGPKPTALSIYGPEQRERSRKLLDMLRDPAGREEIYKERMQMMRPVYSDLGRNLGLSREDGDQLIELLVRQELAVEEAAATCLGEKSCNWNGAPESMALAQEREINERFGPDTFEKLRFYQMSSNQRQAVAALRGQLPDSARLSDAKANELVRALVEEDTRAQKDMERVGYGIAISNNGAYIVAQADPTGARQAAAAEYNQRLRDRAAGILSTEQLAVYQQMIDEAVEQGRNLPTFADPSSPDGASK